MGVAVIGADLGDDDLNDVITEVIVINTGQNIVVDGGSFDISSGTTSGGSSSGADSDVGIGVGQSLAMAAPVIATLGYVASRNTEVVDTVKEIYNIAFSEEKAKFLDGEEGEEEEDEQDFFSYEDEVIGGEDLYIEEEADITPE